MKSAARQITFYTLAIGLWMLVARMHIWPPYLVPSPQGVFESLRTGFADHSFWIAIAISMKRIAIGYSISVAVGIVLGLLLASSEFLEQTLGGLLLSLQSPPASVGCRWRSCGLDCPRRRFFSS
jgi:NitT/TauT family transport system permease protein